MSSYLSNILTNTTSKYNTLRQNLTSSEADGDTEDDSHISRVLRAYYTEKGRQFPQWLPQDPRRSMSTQSVTQSFTSSLRSPSSNHVPMNSQGSKNSLSDLWDQPSQQAAPQQPMSLRRQAVERGNTHQGRGGGDTLQPQARPLPSQRVGSYQSQHQYSEPSPPPSSGSASGGGGAGGTAQERLKARLWGRGGSSTNLSQTSLHSQQQYTPRDRFSPAGPR
ncbi:Sec1-binding region of Mso1-domain-containing protein [Delphinella strobiligena]|nr:Sec1-binding region of Mso1-domain-containing protein [Delphinella strobiligena]